jgi:hypothetical protein
LTWQPPRPRGRGRGLAPAAGRGQAQGLGLGRARQDQRVDQVEAAVRGQVGASTRACTVIRNPLLCSQRLEGPEFARVAYGVALVDGLGGCGWWCTSVCHCVYHYTTMSRCAFISPCTRPHCLSATPHIPSAWQGLRYCGVLFVCCAC